MHKQEFEGLLKRYLNGTCTDEEKTVVEDWYNRRMAASSSNIATTHIEQDVLEVRKRLLQSAKIKPMLTWKRAVAAVAVLAISAYLYWYVIDPLHGHGLVKEMAALETTALDVLPGGNRATIVLASGRWLALSPNQQGIVVGDNGIYYEDGTLVYVPAEHGTANYGDSVFRTGSNRWEVEVPNDYDVLTTPKGGQYQLTLPDGTRVLMNAATSLAYTAANDADERRVYLDGEAYFDVAKDEKRPFKVFTSGQEVEVLGTQFNINSYADEPTVKTTLLNGSVKVTGTKARKQLILQPGEQADLDGDGRLRASAASPEVALAWKNGTFCFDDTDIETIMRQLARWYDVSVRFEGEAPNIKLWGKVYRNANASQALEILEYFGLRYRIQGDDDVKVITIFNN